MVDCKFCDEEFDSKKEMHLHWGDEHEDEISSHDKDKVKRAQKEAEKKEQEKQEWRKKMFIRGTAGASLVILAYFLAPSIIGALQVDGNADFTEADFEDRPVLGERGAEVTIVEFGDYLCPHCQTFNREAKPVIESYAESGDVNYYKMNFPLPNFQPANMQAAVAAECVANQDHDEFWDMHDALFERQNQVTYSDEGMLDLAEEVTEGLDYDQLATCIENDETQDRINNDRQLGQSNRVSATPTVFVNGELVSNWGNMEAVIEERLE